MKLRSIIQNGFLASTPFYEGDGVGMGSGSAPVGIESSQPVVSQPVESHTDVPMRFSDLNKADNPIIKALNEGQAPANNLETDSNTNVEPAKEPTKSELDVVMEEIKKINPKAAEKYNSPESIAKAIINQEKTITNLFQTKAQLEGQLNNLTSEIEKTKIQPQVSQEKETPPAPTPEELEELKSKELELMMEDPLEYKKNLLELAKKQILEEVRQEFKPVNEYVESEQNEREASSFIENFSTATNEHGELLHPDFNDELAGKMAEFLRENPMLTEDKSRLGNALEIAYKVCTAQKTPSLDPVQLLSDEEFVNQHILSNETIKQKFIKGYVQSVKDGQPPVLISRQPGGASPASPIEKPITLKDASKAAKNHYNW